jgi:hypothetical protein
VRMTRDKKSIKTIPVLNPTDQINQVNRTNVSQLKKNNLPFDLSSACIVGRISVTEKENIAVLFSLDKYMLYAKVENIFF